MFALAALLLSGAEKSPVEIGRALFAQQCVECHNNIAGRLN